MMRRQSGAGALIALPIALAVVLVGCSSGSVGEEVDAPNPNDGATTSTQFDSIIPDGDIVAASQEIVDASLTASEGFTPPGGGPAAAASATIAYVGSDLTNGGINAVADGVKEAAAVLGWTVDVYNGNATAQGRSDAMQQAIAAGPDAIVVGGFDPTEQAAVIEQATAQNIPVIGWHAGAEPGPGNGLVTNITTDPLQVAQLAAASVVARSDGTAGVAIFTDGQYDIAVLKADAMQAYVEACADCQVLEYFDSPIAETDQRMPGLISGLLQQYPDDLTDLMAINGNYFGGAQQALSDAGVDPAGPPYATAAGDGDAAEFQRIRTGQYQTATVAEPLTLQGWQIVDEVNRALGGEAPSDFVPAAGLITKDNVPAGDVFDPDSGYRDVYTEAWGK